MSEGDLRTEFEKYGEVENITMLTDKVTNEPKGFAYIKYTKSVSIQIFIPSDDRRLIKSIFN